MSAQPLPVARSAGGVVYRDVHGGIEIVLCGRAAEGLWALPKGTIEDGETVTQTALREVEEETGLRVEIEAELGTISYRFTDEDGVTYDKRVDHHLMVPTGGDVSEHDEEYDDVRWLAADEALNVMRYPSERDIVEQALRLIRRRREER